MKPTSSTFSSFAGEQHRYPAQPREAGAHDRGDHHQRDRQEHAGEPPDQTPERQREHNHERADVERPPHKRGLDDVANHKLDAPKARSHDKKRRERVELNQRQQGRKRNPQDRANVGDKVQ